MNSGATSKEAWRFLGFGAILPEAMRTVRRCLGTIFLVLTVPVSAAPTKIEVVLAGTARSAPAVLPAPQMPLVSPLAAPLAVPVVSPAQMAVPFIQAVAPAPQAAEARSPSPARDEESQADAQSALFDGSELPDIIPEWPGRPGATVRIAGRTHVLGERLGEVLQPNGHSEYEGTNPVYRAKDEPLVVKFIHPSFKKVPLFGGERDALIEMAQTPIVHSGLKASSKDGLVLVKELVEGAPLHRVTKEGPLSLEQRAALLDMTTLFVSLGRTADISPTNLVWQVQKKRWVLIDSGGFAPAQPWAPLGQILARRKDLGIDGVGFLVALRQRLGPDSPEWRAIATQAQAPAHKALLEDLRRHDRW